MPKQTRHSTDYSGVYFVELVDGDPFNSVKLRQSERNIKNTGLFDNVEIKLDDSIDSNKTNLEVKTR